MKYTSYFDNVGTSFNHDFQAHNVMYSQYVNTQCINTECTSDCVVEAHG